MPYTAARGPISLSSAIAYEGLLDQQPGSALTHGEEEKRFVGRENATGEAQPGEDERRAGENSSEAVFVKLKVLASEKLAKAAGDLADLPEGQTHLSCVPQTAGISPSEAALPFLTSTAFLVRKGGSDSVITARVQSGVPEGSIALHEVQRINLHLVDPESYEFEVFTPPVNTPFTLTDLSAEVRLVRQVADAQRATVEARDVARALGKLCFGRIVAVKDLIVLFVNGLELAVRITETNNLSEEEREEAVVYHCYRGLVSSDTAVYVSGSITPQESEGLQLANVDTKRSRPPPNTIVNVYTNDGEWFPVKKKLLRPCIALTKVVQDTGPVAPSITVDVGCLIFDRVLIYLGADALGHASAFDFDINLTEDLASASRALGLRSLLEICERKAGDFDARLREHSFAEICAANDAGGCLLLIDGMVLDVKRWLPEHPGGDSIIPAQALNKESARMFEVYHSSRESFLYLKHFYIGELREEDRAMVPCEEPPSEEFLQHLRDFTPFRTSQQEKKYKSF